MNMFKEFISKYSTVFVTAIITAFATAIVTIVLINPINTLLTYLVTNKAPQVVVRQYYNAVDEAAAVPNRVGDLAIEYRTPKSEGKGVYIVTVANEGSAPDEDLNLQVQYPSDTKISFFKTPDLRVYNPEKIELVQDDFFMALKKFPQNAVASISFIPPENEYLLCDVKLKAATKAIEGKIIQAIEGLQCE